MYLKIAFCVLLLIMLADARMPAQGDHIAVSIVGGPTYYGAVEEMQEGLLSLNCTGMSDQRPMLYTPGRMTELAGEIGGSDEPIFPSIRKIRPVDVVVGFGSISQLIWT